MRLKKTEEPEMNSTLGSGITPRRTVGVLAASLLTLSVNAAPLTRDNGAAVGDNQNSLKAGSRWTS